MARKNAQPIDGQFSIFDETNEINPSLDNPYPVTYGPESSYVDVVKRAGLLEGSLIALGKRNQRLGFDVASHTKPYSAPIWGRYEDITPVVIEGAQRNVYNFLDVAKQDFWAATGFAALRAAKEDGGVISIFDSEIDARGRKMWRDFTRSYGDPQVRAQRDKYKTVLRKAIKNSQKPKQLAA